MLRSFLVILCNNAAALALALGHVLDWGRELGKHARRRVEDSFSFEAVDKQLRAFLLS